MVLLSLSSRLNKALAPFLLKHGLTLRYAIGGGVIRDNPTLDALLLIPFCQRVIALEVHHEVNGLQGSGKGAFDKWADETFDKMFGPDKEGDPEKKNRKKRNLRLQTLEKFLRPVLVPNEQWSDVTRWMFHTRFVMWARKEFIFAMHSERVRQALQTYPKMRRAPQLQKQRSVLSQWLTSAEKDGGGDDNAVDVSFPTSQSITKAFDMQKWSRKKNVEAIWATFASLTNDLGGKVVEVPGTSVRVADLRLDTDLSILSMQDILELAGAHVASTGPFHAICEECDIYQFLSKDYIEQLAQYLWKRSELAETIILEVGAGNGILSAALTAELEYLQGSQGKQKSTKPSRSAPPQIVAVDDGSWKIQNKGNVQKMSVEQAMQTYAGADQQVIVLCSWMPAGVDWTAAFRQAEVDEYILIGEYDDGNCGDNWETWGNTEFFVGGENGEDEDLTTPPYERDGYKRETLRRLTKHQFSRFDSPESANSLTVSFTRKR